MKLGDIEARFLNDGTLKLDGGTLFGGLAKTAWEKLAPPDEKNCVEVGVNCLLVQSGGKNVIVDAGVGSRQSQKTRESFGMSGDGRLLASLSEAGLSPGDIDVVILTHLHFDHTGGCTVPGPVGKPVPAFPRAQYLVQKAELEEAANPKGGDTFGVFEEDVKPLLDAKQLDLLQGDTMVLPGVLARVTGGHSAGHQIVLLDRDGQKACFLGDLIMTPQHLTLRFSQSSGPRPSVARDGQIVGDKTVTKEKRRGLLDQAESEKWLLLFAHGLKERAAYLRRESSGLKVMPVQI